MQSDVYRCGWRRLGGDIETWLLEKPNVRVVARTFHLAEKRLRAAIQEHLDDWEPYIEFWPIRPPKSVEEQRFCDGWVLLSPTKAPLQTPSLMGKLFQKGMCSKCSTGWGKRTKVPLAFPFADFDGVDFRSVTGKDGKRYVVSQDFVTAFMGGSGAGDQLRACEDSGTDENGTAYFELCPKAPVKAVLIREERAIRWQCGLCGEIGIPQFRHVGTVRALARKRDVLKVQEPWFFYVNFWNAVGVAIRADTVRPLESKKGLKGVSIEWLGSVEDSEVYENSPIEIIGEG